MDPQQRGCEHTERPLAANEQLGEIRTGGSARPGARQAAGPHDAAAGEHHLHSRDDVFDLPVPRRVLPRGAARDPSTHRRQLDGLRPVPHRQCVFATQRLLEIDAHGAGAHLDEARRIVNADDSAQCTDVECYAAADGDGTAAHAAPATGGGDRDQIVVTDAQDIGDLGGRRRTHHRMRERRDHPRARPPQTDGPPIA